MGHLTTHVLDTARGRPAAGIRVELFRLGDDHAAVAEATTNADGRVDGPLLSGETFMSGAYELRFHAGDYFRATGIEAAFLDVVPVRFVIDAREAHYHVPLLLSPFGYTTYRGS